RPAFDCLVAARQIKRASRMAEDAATSVGRTGVEEADPKPKEEPMPAESPSNDAEAKSKVAATATKSEDNIESNEASEKPQDVKEEKPDSTEGDANDDAVEEADAAAVAQTTEPVSLGRGGRVRKSVQTFQPETESKRKEKEIPEGKGEKLEDMPNVVANFKGVTWSSPPLKMLYSVVFGTGKRKEFKAHLLQFSGLVYPEGKEEEKKEKLKQKMYKLTMVELKAVMDLVDIERTAESFGNKKETPGKEALCDRFLEWLEEPKASGKKMKGPTKKSPGKRKSAGSAKKPPAKKAKTTPSKKVSAKKSPAKKSPSAKKPPAKKAAARKAPAKKQTVAKSPSKTKSPSKAKSPGAKQSIPGVSLEKLTEKIKSIVENADREELTVKGVRKILEDWLDMDLAKHKDVVRSIVMEVM
ncbi:hypothetical protein ACHAWF_013348, partial [Thalassiosira exigua]